MTANESVSSGAHGSAHDSGQVHAEGHQHDHEREHELETREFWEERYRDRPLIWSGRVNPVLAAEVGSWPPGRVLDLGCGEGGDAIWFAERGWEVTAVDVSAVAIERGTEAAEAAGVADRISWERHDLAVSFPVGTFDLVSAQFFQSPIDLPRAEILGRAAAALRPGGALLAVSHAAFPPWSTQHDPKHRFPTPQEELDALALDPARWDTVRCEVVEREGSSPDGQTGTLLDGVVLVRRRG
ncbi:SAM-dependent methyltransferase [Aquihabitans sp. McL0605]|uniref:SAM-dependent methyltransferase n=1 Tax=Aquihabitans sp. McL0605 TaxID=3415671 RepID=UPI003CEB6591